MEGRLNHAAEMTETGEKKHTTTTAFTGKIERARNVKRGYRRRASVLHFTSVAKTRPAILESRYSLSSASQRTRRSHDNVAASELRDAPRRSEKNLENIKGSFDSLPGRALDSESLSISVDSGSASYPECNAKIRKKKKGLSEIAKVRLHPLNYIRQPIESHCLI